ncbi:DEAD/DEAH box helicase [Novispirillum itersonii]|uniref:Superfamily II DNA or RNA helicase n=1 Tax=Novispirillum itersonii TaxID=189 RepID=A0A7W9ZJW5_NOVIT|nr:DEAD/DEAH box helicase [Novispirillum itersonii]MBB6212525.1 superfamily II DNA or RNA helicase [Novispirillum itersonii]
MKDVRFDQCAWFWNSRPENIGMITRSMLRRHFDAGTFERGERYHRQGRVSALHSEADAEGAIRVVARVRGSLPSPYRQDIRLFLRNGALTSVSGVCGCPVGLNCKHVAAVLLAWADRPLLTVPVQPPTSVQPALPESAAAVRHLLSRLEAAAALDADDAYPDTVHTRLVYALRLDEQPGGREAVVRFLSVSLRKDGQFGAQKPYTPESIRAASVAQYITPTDRTILSAVLEQRGYGRSSWHGTPLQGERAVWLIERMLRTGRLHWEDIRANPPLRSGPVRTGEARWTADADGRQRFAIALDIDTVHLLPTVPPLYVDPDRWECGAVTTRVPPHLAAALLSAPPLAPADIPAFRQGATRFGALLPVLPEPPAGTETRRIVPRPVLRLRRGRRVAPPADGHFSSYGVDCSDDWVVPVAELGFDYDGRRVAADVPSAPFQWMETGVLITVPRAAKEEVKAATRLRAVGLALGDSPLTVAGEAARRRVFTIPGDAFDVSIGWLGFCDTVVPTLRAEGWIILIDPDFPYQVMEAPEGWAFELGEGSGIDWFGLSLGVEVGGERIDLLPALRTLIAALDEACLGGDPSGGDIVEEESRRLDAALEAMAPEGTLYMSVGGNRFLSLAVDRLKPMISVLVELFGLQPGGEGLRIGRAHLGDLAALEEAASAACIPLLGADTIRRMARALAETGGVPAVAPPAGLRGVLRPYQQAGLDWLQFLGAHGFGGILADDMGLGKTVQALAHLLAEREAGRLDRPSLLVAPTSVLGNWRAEAARFAPGLRTLVLHGPQRKADLAGLGGYDLVVTSYALLPRDLAALAAQPWHLAIFDEAQYLKNPASQAAKAALALEVRQRLCLTGTPVENSLDELWSLFAVAVPTLLGERTGFRRQFRTPIEKHGDAGRRRLLARRLRPFLLRRTKEEVAGDLPPKTEILETVEPDGGQRDLYETIRLAMDERVRAEIACKGLARSRITILDALLKLRQVCCDPRLVKLEVARRRTAKGAPSAKLARLLEMLPGLLADGRRILLFSQFTSMLDLVKPELDTLGIAFVELTGDTKDRETPVRRFQAGEVPLFLISLKAGGTGLNLTAADTVIHYDPWWNPAVEDQATDRAHRIGQDRPVFVYRLVAAGTVEERMLELQKRKRWLGEAIYGQDGAGTDTLTADDVAFLLAPIGGGNGQD